MIVELDGVQHEFPDDATQDEIRGVLSKHTKAEGSTIGRALSKAFEPITSIPSTYMGMVGEAKERIGRGAKQIGEGDVLSGAGNLALGGLDYVTSPISAPIHTIVGKPLQENLGVPEVLSETAAGFMLPIPKGLPRMGRGVPAAAVPSMLDVTLSEGQASRELPAIQREQAAVRGQSGPPAQRVAQEFMDQQAGQTAATRERIARSFDPFSGASPKRRRKPAMWCRKVSGGRRRKTRMPSTPPIRRRAAIQVKTMWGLLRASVRKSKVTCRCGPSRSSLTAS